MGEDLRASMNESLVAKVKERLLGADVLAALSITGAALTREYLAVGIIALMLITGRALERWAEGQAEREFKALLARMPRTSRKVLESGEIVEISIASIEIGDRLLVRNGEITPTDGTLLLEAQLDESALTGEPVSYTHLRAHETG
jgi:cation transport ATPase